MFGRSRTDLKLWRGSSLKPVEPVVETRTQLRLELGHSHAVFNVWRGSHLRPANGLAAISWSSRQGARHTRSDLECLLLRAVSLWLGWTSRGTMTQIMGEIVKVADTCTSGGHALQDEPNARHRRHSLDASGLRSVYHTCQQAYPKNARSTCPRVSRNLRSCCVATPDQDRQHSPHSKNVPDITWRCKPRAHATHHGRDAQRTCCREHPVCLCSVLHCTCAMLISSRQCQPRRQYRHGRRTRVSC